MLRATIFLPHGILKYCLKLHPIIIVCGRDESWLQDRVIGPFFSVKTDKITSSERPICDALTCNHKCPEFGLIFFFIKSSLLQMEILTTKINKKVTRASLMCSWRDGQVNMDKSITTRVNSEKIRGCLRDSKKTAIRLANTVTRQFSLPLSYRSFANVRY